MIWDEGLVAWVSKGKDNSKKPLQKTHQKLLGDRVEQALTLVGVTEERVSNWLGRPCGCKGRRDKLNLLHSWAEKKLKGLFKSDQAATDELEEIIE